MRWKVLLVAPAALLAFSRAPAAGDPAEPASPAEDVVRLRFAWPPGSRAKVSYRRTRTRSGAPRSVFVARWEMRAEAAEGGLRIATAATSWRGDVPFPPALVASAIRASEAVVQRVRADGEFDGLDGAAAMRPVLAQIFEDAKVPVEERERAVAVAGGAMRAEAEEAWNLAVGFWIGADLAVGETYALESEADVPLAPGIRARHSVEFSLRRRVPCAAAERAPRCVEATLRSIPDPSALERAAPALLARLFAEGEVPEGAREELSAESELVLVTDPATLLPRRVVWTKAVRVGAGEGGRSLAEQVDRSEYDYRWAEARPTEPRRASASTSPLAP